MYITVMLVQRVITGRYSKENEIWMITMPSGSTRNDRAGHSQAGVQMSQRGCRCGKTGEGAQDDPGHSQKCLTSSHRNADIDKTSLGLIELGASI